MISLRKQLFTIFFAIGIAMVLCTSMIVNIIIKKNFEDYVNNNIKEAGDTILELVQESYNEGTLSEDVVRASIIDSPMGNFAVSILDRNKEYLWGVDKAQFFNKLQKEVEKEHVKLDYHLYREVDRPYYTKAGEVAGYVRTGYYPSDLLSRNDKKFQNNVKVSIIWCSSMILMWFLFAGLYISRLFTYHIYGISKTSIALADGKLNARYLFKSKIKEIETLRHSMNYLGEKLERQDTIRKKLISDVSHEIRTPLQILQSNLEAMIDGIYPIDEEQMNILYKEVVRFGKLLNNLDLLKNVEESESKMNFRVINLNESLTEVFDAFKIVAKEKKINYQMKNTETERVMLSADKDALKQLWMNIVSNALKFTGEKGEIRVITSLQHKECTIIIQDSGIGIAEEDLPFVFERMYRGDKSRELYEGSGIGLTMVKNIVEKHRGKVKIESKEGKYTKVIVTLPVHTLMLEPNNISSKMKSYMKIGSKNQKD
ncbi:MAG: HAMP domain-containing sensor histidine kinase [Cellulosilyticum sp.]|nr:HAMP domain-containing sensor histidine kinase [Cellulosilyticum sp.]